MIRAVVKDGVIQPLEPLPAEWKEGREVIVDDLAYSLQNESDEFDKWSAQHEHPAECESSPASGECVTKPLI